MNQMSEEERESVESITSFAHKKLKEFGVSGTVTVAILDEGTSYVHSTRMSISEIGIAINALRKMGEEMLKEALKKSILEGMFDEHS